MILALYICLTWFVVMLFFAIKEKFTKEENLFLFFTMSIVIIISFTIFSLNLNFIQPSKDPTVFLALILYRTVIAPLLTLLFINLIHSAARTKVTYVKALTAFLFFNLLEFLSLKLGLFSFLNWHLFYSFSIFIFFFTASFLFHKFYQKLRRWQVN
jgi:hypothetical protein